MLSAMDENVFAGKPQRKKRLGIAFVFLFIMPTLFPIVA
jgi:nitrate reductase NapE component